MNIQENIQKNQKIHWINVGWLIGSPLALAIFFPIQWTLEGTSLGFWLFFVISVAVTNLSITAGYHRLFSHRSYEARRWVRWLYLFLGAGAFQGSVISWATDHRRHHRFVDTNEDPYSIKKGFFYAHMGWLFRQEPTHDIPKDLTNSRWIVLQHRYYVIWAIAAGFLLPMGIGSLMGSPFAGLIYGGLLRVVVSQHCTFLINSACHYVGRQPYNLNNSARDSWIMAVLAFGEGYHNYHHRFQADYRNGIRWYHWDPTKWLIRGLSFCGGTYRLRTTPEFEIFKARMAADRGRLLAKGVAPERIQALKERIELAQERMRHFYQEYWLLRKERRADSRKQILQLRAEWKVSKLEFKLACRQWYTYLKTFKATPAFSFTGHVAG